MRCAVFRPSMIYGGDLVWTGVGMGSRVSGMFRLFLVMVLCVSGVQAKEPPMKLTELLQGEKKYEEAGDAVKKEKFFEEMRADRAHVRVDKGTDREMTVYSRKGRILAYCLQVTLKDKESLKDVEAAARTVFDEKRFECQVVALRMDGKGATVYGLYFTDKVAHAWAKTDFRKDVIEFVSP